MADRRVYQGVRVRTTVKELLQRLRAGAREAETGHTETISRACADLQDLCAYTFTGRPVAPPPPAAPAPGCGARAFQPDGSCVQMPRGGFSDVHQQQQFGDMMLPGNGYIINNNNNNNNNNNHNHHNHSGGGGGGYPACLPPPPAFPLPCFHGLSSDADYYGHGMGPCSSPEPLALGHPADPSSYSPQDSFSSSSSSSCYDSPTRMESCHFLYQPCGPQDGPRWPGPQDSLSGPECAPYFPPSDYPYAGPEQDCFRSLSSELCYNVL